jgi:putative ubiquitin-RnfH superfamily antitoxin RatB of RatAB toxin-antitoxin module
MPEITVEIIYALPDIQEVITLRVPQGTTIKQALKLSNLAVRYPEIKIDSTPVGIFGRCLSNDTVLSDHDRVEVYRPLHTDPKQYRRDRARHLKETSRKKS